MQWIQMRDIDEIRDFNKVLFKTDATIYQFPYWNNSLEFPLLKPTYLKCMESGELQGYLSLCEVGLPGLKFCTIHHGPITLNRAEDKLLWISLMKVLERKYAFAKFAPRNSEDLEQIKSLKQYRIENVNSFPFHTPLSECLVVAQESDDEAMLYKFGETARRLIRKAERIGYKIRYDNSPKSFEEAWPLYQKLSETKGFSFRPSKSYVRLIQEAAESDLVRIYSAYYGKDLIQSILVVLDGRMAWYMSGALDVTKIFQNTTPSFFLHFRAMRDLYHEKGLTLYNLGSKSGKVFEFKSRFNPASFHFPPSLTVVFNPFLFKMYSESVLRFRKKIKRRIKKVIR